MGRVFFTQEQLGAAGVDGLDSSKFVEITAENSQELIGKEWLDGVRNPEGLITSFPQDKLTKADLLICKVNDEIGYTVIALGEIKAGDIVCDYGAELIDQKDMEEDDTTLTPVDLGGDLSQGVLSAKKATNVGPYINHAPDANTIKTDYRPNDKSLAPKIAHANLLRMLAESQEAGKPPAIILGAEQDIPRGTVLTYDYSLPYFLGKQQIPQLFFKDGNVVPLDQYRYNFFVLELVDDKRSRYFPMNAAELSQALRVGLYTAKNGTTYKFTAPAEVQSQIRKKTAENLKHYTPSSPFIASLQLTKIISAQQAALTDFFSSASAAARRGPTDAQMAELQRQMTKCQEQEERETAVKARFTKPDGTFDKAAYDKDKSERRSQEREQAFEDELNGLWINASMRGGAAC